VTEPTEVIGLQKMHKIVRTLVWRGRGQCGCSIKAVVKAELQEIRETFSDNVEKWEKR